MPDAEILSQGDEVITGQTLDSNAAWLGEELTLLGFTVRRAQAFHRPLQFDAEAMGQIESMFARFGREMPEINRKQAWFPQGAERLDNRWGTAPGFAMDGGDAWLAFLPGVPREMRSIARDLAQRIGEAVFSVEGLPGVDGVGGSLAEAVTRLLRPGRQTVAAVEIGTCGELARLCGDGSSGSAGLNHLAVADAGGVEHRAERVLANRNLNRRFAAAGVLNLLRLHICRRSSSSLLTAL